MCYNIAWTGQILLPDCVYCPSYSILCVSCFMLGHLMTSWYLNIKNIKSWLSQEREELSKWNNRHTKQTSKNVANATFKAFLAKNLSFKLSLPSVPKSVS